MASNWSSAEPWMGALCNSSPRATYHALQEQFYEEQIVNITEARNDKDKDDFEKIKQS